MPPLKALAATALLALGVPVAMVVVTVGPGSSGSPASALASTEIPAGLLPVYEAAAQMCPGLPWQVLAAIGWAESRHAEGHVDPATGDVAPPIVGPAIEGRSGSAAIPDPSQPDGWAHALGPMQFLSTTWASSGLLAPDRPPNAVPSVQNAWDSIYSAAVYLCDGQPELTDVDAAILRYNHSEAYLRDVKAKAVAYGLGAPDQGPAAAPIPGSGDAVVAVAMTVLGTPYVWGGESPETGFDCSGLVQWAYAQIGVSLPRTTFEQMNEGTEVSVDDMRPGDLIFTRGGRSGDIQNFGHVAIYAGGGQEIVAPHTGDVVSLRDVNPASVQGVRRILS